MNILIVDAHWATRAGLASHLLDINPRSKITEIENLDMALQALASKTSFDLCLFDFSIPEIEPLGELKRLRQTAPTVPIIVMTATDSRRWALRAIESGAAGLFLKSSPRAALDIAIERVLSGEIWLPAGLADTPEPGILQETQTSYIYEDDSSPLGVLTSRQRQVLELVATGKRNADIATALEISPRPVQIHVSTILKLLKVNNRTEAALLAHKFEQAKAG